MKEPRQSSNILVKPLRFTGLNEQAIEAITKLRGEPVKSVTTLGKVGIIEVGEDLFVLLDEGVINTDPITDANPFRLDFYAEYESGEVDIFPSAVKSLNKRELKSFANLPEVPLEIFVRSFGARLETNYATIVKFINGRAITSC